VGSPLGSLETRNHSFRWSTNSRIVVLTMDAKLRKVTRIPLEELWRPNGPVIGPRIRMLNQGEIAELLREGQIEFVVADVDHHLRWIAPQDCFDFWKNEVKRHLVEADSRIDLESFPGTFCYTASQWENVNPEIPIILLERHH
jgi:hypothetical protein